MDEYSVAAQSRLLTILPANACPFSLLKHLRLLFAAAVNQGGTGPAHVSADAFTRTYALEKLGLYTTKKSI